MKKTLLLLLLTVAGLVAQAQIPNGYYNSANGKTRDELRSALHEIIKDHTTISYQQIWNAFWSTDNKGNNVVWDMYSDGATYTYSYMGGNDQCGEYEQEGDCYNREHSWPQSWFSNASTPTTDLHHIFPTDGFVNFKRSNYPFGEVQSATWTSQNGSKLGNCKSTLGYTGTVFEPIDEYKGDFARAYFYMSTRYYTEDSDWGTSGMTNKADIKPWAITMLLRWSDADPVSQKEIDRNNAVFGIQGNRNPFIDHPEYAHIIWEPGWTGVTYNITTASVSHGTISAPSTAVEGTMVTLTATPTQGYMLSSWSVYKTSDPSTTVSVSSSGTFTMPSFNVTVSATFVQNNTQYSITCATGLAHGSISTNVSSATSGTTVTLSNTPASGYTLYSYYVYKTGDLNTIVYSDTGNNFTMPAFDVTVSASFVQPSSYSYVKATSTPANWSGDYLIVCEDNNVAFNGTVDNNWGRCSGVTITDHTIENNTTTEAYKVNISGSSTNGYQFKLPSNQYMNWTGDKKFSEGTTAKNYSISLDNGNVSITYSTNTLQYNPNTGNSGGGGLRSYASANQTPIQLYKKTGTAAAPTHTIHFDKNGGSGTMNDQTVNEFEPTALQANAFTRTGFAFDSWNTAANGSGTTYFDGATVTLLNDLTLYAQWKPLYTITVGSIANGSVSVSASQAVEGAIITLSATPASGYEFDHWTVTDGTNNIVVVENQFEMPASNITVSASFVYVGQAFEQKYYLVTSTDQLVADRTYLIVNTELGKALGSQNSDNNRAAVAVSIDNSIIENINSANELTLGKSGNYWTFYIESEGAYLCATSNTTNQLGTEATLDNNGKWSISIGNDGNATITAQGSNSYKHMRYNKSKTWFTCFNNQTSGKELQLYIRSEEIDHPADETIPHLFSFDKHVIRSGTTLTVTGTVSCNEANYLIIEDGGQLVHHSDGVQATVKRTIQAYTPNDSDGWYTIATPFTTTTYDPTNALTTTNYDLFAYDESATGAEWRNYKAANFILATGHGYLYAHNPTTTLRMTGTLNNGDYSNTVDLGYDNNNADIRGFNLLGNPTAHDINFTKTVQVSDGYYYVENGSSLTYVASNTVPAGRGFFVKANAANQSVTLNSNSKRDNSETIASLLQIDVDGEQAYVKLTEGVSMPLLDFRGRHSNVYLTKEGKNYIMLVRDNADAIDLCYQPSPGTHTLSVKAENLDYLHLIDHLTGNNIDLLANPSYSFESGVKDYTSRFQLLFSPKANDDVYGDSFVDGKTVIIDLIGRVVATDRNAKLAPGIYLLRTVNGNEVKTKKVLIN